MPRGNKPSSVQNFDQVLLCCFSLTESYFLVRSSIILESAWFFLIVWATAIEGWGILRETGLGNQLRRHCCGFNCDERGEIQDWEQVSKRFPTGWTLIFWTKWYGLLPQNGRTGQIEISCIGQAINSSFVCVIDQKELGHVFGVQCTKPRKLSKSIIHQPVLQQFTINFSSTANTYTSEKILF